MAIESLIYPKTFHYYDGERRDRAANVAEYYNTRSRTFYYAPTFIFDLENTSSSNRHTFTLMSFANGVRLDADIWYSAGASTNTNWYIQGEYFFVDKNGNRMAKSLFSEVFGSPTWNNAFAVSLNKTLYPSLSDIRLNPAPLVKYSSDSTATVLNLMSWTYKIPNASPYDAPALQGTIDNQLFSRYYSSNDNLDITTQARLNKLWEVIENNGDGTPVTPTFPSQDTSGTGGGDSADPDYNPFSDPIPFPDLPSVSALNMGLISAYNPTDVQLRLLAGKLWSDDFFDEIKKINNDPMEAVISLHLVPIHLTPSTTRSCKIGNYDSEITMPVIGTQFMNVSGGSIQVNERFASALDYSPYTTVYIHIPFVGIVPLDIDYIMKKTITVNYQVDILTGSAVAMVKCNNALLYTFPCDVAMKIPLTSSNHQALYQHAIDMAASVGDLAVSAGAVGGDVSPMAVGHSTVRALESALSTVASKHSEVQKSGSITGAQGILDSYETYLIFHRPIQSLASDFAHFKGFPCNITYTLSSLSGYTEVEYAHLEGVTATDAEKDEIQSLLYAGVIL